MKRPFKEDKPQTPSLCYATTGNKTHSNNYYEGN